MKLWDIYRQHFTNKLSPEELNIALIGAGKIAFSLTGELSAKDVRISNIISRSVISAKELADSYSIYSYSDDFSDIDDKVNLVIISVSDGEILPVAQAIAGLKSNFHNKLFIHLSGSLSRSVLEPIESRGAKTASLHILQTFPSKTPVPIKGCYSAIETTDQESQETLFKLAKKLDLIPFKIASEAKTNYHIAGVFASNFLAGNIFSSQNLTMTAGIEPDAIDMFLPIVKTTLANIESKGPAMALSGPIERNDIVTINAHLSSLNKLILDKKIVSETEKFLLLSYLSQSLLLTKAAAQKKENDEIHIELKNRLVAEIKKLVNFM